MFYYFLADSLTNEFRTTVLLYADIYMVTNVPVASALLKQIIILTRVDNPASTMHIREMLIESKQKLLLLKGNITEFIQWVRKQMGHLHAWEQEAVDLLYYLWKAYKAAPNDEFVIYIKELKSQADDSRATYTVEDLMVCTENKYEARLLDEENTWGKPTDELEKIVAMTAEINSLKRERRGTSDKTTKSTTKEKKPAAKKPKEQKKAKESQKKKSSDKWAFVEFLGLLPLILFFNTSTGWFGRFVLSTECYRTRKLGYNNINWPSCSAWVTESLVLTDGGFCQKQTLYISDYVKFVSL